MHLYEQAEELREVGAAVAPSAYSMRYLQARLDLTGPLAAPVADVDGLVFRSRRTGDVVGGEPLQGGFLGRRRVDGLKSLAILSQSWRAA